MELARDDSIPDRPHCCCGSSDCPFLQHNESLVEGLERNVNRAAVLGQALLSRHEAYVADSERERKHMLSTIEGLEKDKVELEEKNAQAIKANRQLLDRLEELNNAVASSDAQIKALSDTLHSTEEELQRLSSLAARTQMLEAQLLDLEREQMQTQTSLELKLSDEKTAIQRWKRAERVIADLQDQIDRIEKESREERERHVEIVARMERRMAVDGELATAAGRLKAKAGVDKSGTNVVSHFVKDILLDNVNLQHGIVELREMLDNSNKEVERLREYLGAHQPVSPTESPTELATPQAATPNLQKELAGETVYNQELHIHHHYSQPIAKTPSKPPARRPRKKRFSLTPGHFTPPMQADPATQTTILTQTAVTVPNTNRWSNATTLAPSLPSSPLSASHRGSIYDRVFSDANYDSSRPTSPSDSIDLQSPNFGPKSYFIGDISQHNRKKSQSLKPPSLATIRSVSTPVSITAKSSPASAVVSGISPAGSLANDEFVLSPSLQAQPTIPEEGEDSNVDSNATPENLVSPPPNARIDDEELGDLISPLAQSRPTLRRAVSHESLISISGMDIHTLQLRPSQLLLSASPRFATPGGTDSLNPELTPWTATATARMSRRDLDSSAYNRSLLYSSTPRAPSAAYRIPSAGGLGKKVGGWVLGRWGTTPASPSATSSPRPDSSKSAETQSSTDTVKKDLGVKKKEVKKEVRLRAPGVNQDGPIWGFFDIKETPTKVVVEEYDAEALGEALGEALADG
ncbi:uncharacterized protein CC84DRAFT_1144501 [Paraphaeosphaeria sporulosa]|uniref:Uncharacterized protein n=1 Tax=Paraphaeosphaeria sporulosa TaxID=1460663 RepID=A0A177CLS7_9PLEO|nr:uncharacterized protein CC84DRAFT_1144501 [Paraphaeosphaeria sporulosa]OAG07737.1 hypothetical protein CC84DRAFT_1144501 [Paraphaeosphaeria sporulosa]